MKKEELIIKKLLELSTKMIENTEYSEEERLSYACAINDAIFVVVNSGINELQIPDFPRG